MKTLTLILALLALPALALPPDSVYMSDRDRSGQIDHIRRAMQVDSRPLRWAYGDSMVAAWVLSHIGDRWENFGISGTSLLAVCRDITHYTVPGTTGEAVLVSAGSNDTRAIIAGRWPIKESFAAQQCIVDAVKGPLIVLEIPQMFYEGSDEANHLRNSLNLSWRRLLDNRPGARLIRWPITEEKTLDQLHPGPVSYAEREADIRNALVSFGLNP